MKFGGKWRVSFFREGDGMKAFLERDFETLVGAWKSADVTNEALYIADAKEPKDQQHSFFYSISDLTNENVTMWGGHIDQRGWI